MRMRMMLLIIAMIAIFIIEQRIEVFAMPLCSATFLLCQCLFRSHWLPPLSARSSVFMCIIWTEVTEFVCACVCLCA